MSEVKCSTCENVAREEEMTEISNLGQFVCEECWTGSGEPKKFAFSLILRIEEFEANDADHAKQMLNEYIDRLAEVKDDFIKWGECDWQAYQDGQIIEIPIRGL